MGEYNGAAILLAWDAEYEIRARLRSETEHPPVQSHMHTVREAPGSWGGQLMGPVPWHDLIGVDGLAIRVQKGRVGTVTVVSAARHRLASVQGTGAAPFD